jgi:hypothetical protein
VDFARLVLRLSALAFAGIGAAFLFDPASMAGFVGVSSSGATADNDIRAVYGGLQLGCAAVLWAASRRTESLHLGLFVQILLFSGLALGRFVSWSVVGLPDALGLGLHAAELVAIGAGLAALLRLRP